jgi:hypothetical protein
VLKWELKDLLRGICTYGFERPSAIQQPCVNGNKQSAVEAGSTPSGSSRILIRHQRKLEEAEALAAAEHENEVDAAHS